MIRPIAATPVEPLPAVSAALGIPYLMLEASFAPKQAGGSWALGHHATEQALSA